MRKLISVVIILTLLSALPAAKAAEIRVNGAETISIATVNIDGIEFMKLRGLAMALDFGVAYEDHTVFISSVNSYEPNGTENADPIGEVGLTNDRLIVNGVLVETTIFKIGGSNYITVFDLAEVVGFETTVNDAIIEIATRAPEPAPQPEPQPEPEPTTEPDLPAATLLGPSSLEEMVELGREGEWYVRLNQNVMFSGELYETRSFFVSRVNPESQPAEVIAGVGTEYFRFSIPLGTYSFGEYASGEVVNK